jgi:lysophospholipase L1-like esterase
MAVAGEFAGGWFSDPEVIFITNRVRSIINSQPQEKQKTIVIIGDSFTQGDPVPYKDNYPSVLQQTLNEKLYDHHVVNLGVGGFGTDQELRLFQKYLTNHPAPSVVIWQFYNNDIYENYTQPVFDVQNNKLVPLSAKTNWIYLRQQFYDSVPLPRSIKMSSLLLNRTLHLFEKRKTAQIPPAFIGRGEDWSQLKIREELAEMTRLANQHGFHFYPFFITPQAMYIQEPNRSQAAQWTASDFIIISGEAHNFAGVFIQNFLLSGEEEGVATKSALVADAYFANDGRDPMVLGVRHLNERGYHALAEQIFQLLKDGGAFDENKNTRQLPKNP